MKAYLIVVVLMFAISVIGKAMMLSDGTYLRPRNANYELIDIAIGVLMVVWGGYLWGTLK